MISKGYLTNITTILLLVCTGFLSSCNKEEVAISMNYPVEVNVTETTDTKISTNGENLFWQEGDQLSLFAASADNSSTGSATLELNSIDAGSATGKFKGEISLSAEPNMCYFTHPSSCTPSYADSKVSAVFDYSSQDGTHKPFLWGKAAYPTGGGVLNCTLSHVGGMVYLTNIPSGVTSITIKGNSAEQLSPVTINMADGSATIGSNTEFTFSISGTSAYICMPPVNFSKGFSIIYNSDSGSMYKSYSSDGGANSGYDFTASTYVTIDAGGDFTPLEVASSATYTHTVVDGYLTGTQVTATPNLQGAPAKITTWRAELIHPDGSTVVRTISSNKTFSATTMEVVEDWLYLPEGEYTYKAYYSQYGGSDVEFTSKTITIEKATAPVKISLSSTINHICDASGILTGSTATVTATNNSNLPITSWSAILRNSDNTSVREISGNTSFGTVEFSGSGYISRQKTYTPEGTCVVKGDVLNCATASQINAPDPTGITISVAGYTTYDYRTTNINAANTIDNRLKIKEIKATPAGYDSSLSSYSSVSIICDNSNKGNVSEITGLSVGTHSLQAQVIFDGLTFTSATVTKHITGLPFLANPPTSSDGWTLEKYCSIQDDGLRVGGYTGDWQAVKSWCYLDIFHIPGDINVTLNITISKVTTFGTTNTLNIAPYNNSSTSDNIISTSQKKCSNVAVTGSGTLTSTYKALYIENEATVIGKYFTIHYFFLQYKN